MKQPETMKVNLNKNHLYVIVMVLCFIYGGVSLVIFIGSYSHFMTTENFRFPNMRENSSRNFSIGFNDALDRPNFRQERIRTASSLVMAVSILGSIISILAGICILDLVKKKDKKELTMNIIN